METTSTETLLDYKVALQPVSHTSERITLTITRKAVGFCKYFILYVPIGEGEKAIFSKSPTIKSSLDTWSLIGSVPEQTPSGPAASVGEPTLTAGQSYQRFIVYNQNSTATTNGLSLLTDTTAAAVNTRLVLTITGNINATDGKAKIIVAECSKATSEVDFATRSTDCEVDKLHSLLLYIDSFVASSTTADPTKPLVPITKLRSGQAFKLSWESNGRAYRLFQDGKSLTLKPNETASYTVDAGITTDTTFVLQAISPDETLYASLAIAVSNPNYSPEQVVPTLKRALEQTDAAALRRTITSKRALELSQGATILLAALGQTRDSTVENAIRQTTDIGLRSALRLYIVPNPGQYNNPGQFGNPGQYNNPGQSGNPGQYGNYYGNPNQYATPNQFGGSGQTDSRSFQQIIQQATGIDFKRALQNTNDPTLQRVLLQTTDAALKAALLDTSDPTLTLLLQKSSDADLKAALLLLDVPALKRLFEQSTDAALNAIKRILLPASNPPLKYTLGQNEDTDYSLRVSDGTPSGNIVLQALTGDANSGFTAISFNGYSSGGDQLFNPTKARYRVGTDQRKTTDSFFIDAYYEDWRGKQPIKTALSVNREGYVGIGTKTPYTTLDLGDSCSSPYQAGGPPDPTGKKLAVYNSANDNGNEFYGFGVSRDTALGRESLKATIKGQLNFFAGAGQMSGPQMVLTSDGNIGIGTSTPSQKLDVSGNVNVSGNANVTSNVIVNGKVGINTSDPKGTLDVNGEIFIGGTKPIIIQRYTGLPDNGRTPTTYSSLKYAAAITGMTTTGGDIDEGGDTTYAIIDCRMHINSNTKMWEIRADFRTHFKGETWAIDVMFIDRRMADFFGF